MKFSGSLKPYAGNYSKYEKQREVEIEGLLARYAQQQEEIKNSKILFAVLEQRQRRLHRHKSVKKCSTKWNA